MRASRRFPPFLVASLLGLSAAFACSTVNSRIREHQAEFDALTPDAKQLIREHEIAPGFNEDMVYMALGRPSSVDTTHADGHVITRWIYTSPVAVAPPGSPPPGFASPYEFPVVGPGPSRPYPMFYGKRTLTVEFENGRVRGETPGDPAEPTRR